MQLLNGRIVRDKILEDIKINLNNINKTLGLAVISIGENKVNDIFVLQKEKICTKLGIEFRDIKLDSNIEEEQILKIIDELNIDNNIDGIMIELPIIGQFNKEKILDRIDYRKDVDGLTKKTREKLLNNKECIISSTVEAILEIFKYYQIELPNKKIVIVGNGFLVGSPLSTILKNKNLNVTICDSKTNNLLSEINNADIIVSCVGKKNLITSNMLKNNQVIIDVGVTVDNGINYGDVERINLDELDISITPIIGGVGVVTVVSLINNLIKCYELKNKEK